MNMAAKSSCRQGKIAPQETREEIRCNAASCNAVRCAAPRYPNTHLRNSSANMCMGAAHQGLDAKIDHASQWSQAMRCFSPISICDHLL
ncbi:unnamed protein product [Periconia digitata]|uniref:Uncharacterized protein n=1 Tax=Periconia digitata TaxID=1303443 RepID=A0A9W4XX47_9PLEO|nr:unnamed protein product [Periconia digitata]